MRIMIKLMKSGLIFNFEIIRSQLKFHRMLEVSILHHDFITTNALQFIP